jgi:hypothetical protein
LDQAEVLAVAVQFEIGMQWTGRVLPVLLGGKHDQVGIGPERHGRELPLGQVIGLIGQEPAVQVHGARSRVVDLDPIGFVPVLVIEPIVVDRHELADQEQILSTKRQSRAKDEHD